MRNKKIWGCLLASGLILFLGCLTPVFAVDSTALLQKDITGGASFGGAALIEASYYKIAALPQDGKQYFYFTVKAGQEAKVSAKFAKAADSDYDTNIGINLYGADEQELRNEYGMTGETLKFSVLPSSKEASNKFYFEIYNDGIYDAGPVALTMEAVDRYDAGSQTDAGGDINSAMGAKEGEYKGYLSGGDITNFLGDDLVDFYKFTVKTGQTLNIKATPSVDAAISLAIYDTQKKKINEVSTDNPGQIINLPFTVQKGGEVFLAVACYNEYCGDKLASYDLGIGAAAGGGADITADDDTTGGGVVPGADDTADDDSTGDDVISDDDSGDDILPPLITDRAEPFSSTFMIGNLIVLAVMLLFWLAMYVYYAVCLQKLAKRTGETPAWLAWIPVVSAFLMLKVAQKPMWWFVLFFVPVVNIVAGVIVWMEIAKRTGKEGWIGILILAPVIGIAIPGYLAFSGESQKKTEEPVKKEPEFIGGTKEADKPAVGYKHPCKYCEKMINPDSAVCPFCGKVSPLGPDRCPKCKNPIEKDWKTCAHCGLNLRIVCPFCGKVTFFGDYCEDCQKELKVKCPYCQFEQPPVSDNCIKCGQPLQKPAGEK